jgi:DNA-binding IclR family transcriptional regulator
VKAIAVPLHEAGQSPRGALTVALPDSRFRDEDYRETVVERLLATRAEVPGLETVSDDRPV